MQWMWRSYLHRKKQETISRENFITSSDVRKDPIQRLLDQPTPPVDTDSIGTREK